MDMFLKHSSFLQPALCRRNNNRKVAITPLFSSHFQMIEITGLLQPEPLALGGNATWSPTRAICLWVQIWMWKGSKASCVTSFRAAPLSRELSFAGGGNAKIIGFLNSYVEKLARVWAGCRFNRVLNKHKPNVCCLQSFMSKCSSGNN